MNLNKFNHKTIDIRSVNNIEETQAKVHSEVSDLETFLSRK